jgi:hypothetical protein
MTSGLPNSYFLLWWSGTEFTITVATTGLLYQPWMTVDDDECGAIGEMPDRENWSTRIKPASVPLCPPQIPHDLNGARTRATAVGYRRLTARATPRLGFRLTTKVSPLAFPWNMNIRSSLADINLSTEDANNCMCSFCKVYEVKSR